MSNVLFGWPLTSDTATVTGGSWLAALPVTNVQTASLAAVARSTTDALADTILNVDYGAASAVSVVALVRHNMRSTALWRIRGSTVSNFATSVYDSAWIAVWPVQWPTSTLPAGHPNAATRLFTDAQINALNPPRDAVHVLATETSARYWRIEIDETANTDTYVQIGRLVMAPRFQPSQNFDIGSEFGFQDGTAVGESMAGVRYYDVRPKGRTLSLAFGSLPDPEAITVMREMVETLSLSGQLYVVTDPADTYNLQRRSFLANLKELGPVAYAWAASYSSVPLLLHEVI